MTNTLIDFRELRAQASFEAVLAHYGLKTIGRGAQRTVLCPFHTEQNPSCKVNVVKKNFKCFGCGAKGNVLDFVQHMDDVSLTTAAERLADICKIELPVLARTDTPRGEQKPRPETKTHEAKNDTSAAKPSEADPASNEGETGSSKAINPPLTFSLKLDPAHPYLTERGLTPEVVETFGLGYCSRGLMKGRICIPIHNESGGLVAYAGRWPGDEGWPEGEDKYRLPQHFKKSHVLYNLNRVRNSDELVVVEGYFAVYRLHMLGIPAVALMGCSISEEQIMLLARETSRLTVLFDGDTAGRTARKEVVPRLSERFYVHAPLLPEATSPDSVDEDILADVLDSP